MSKIRCWKWNASKMKVKLNEIHTIQIIYTDRTDILRIKRVWVKRAPSTLFRNFNNYFGLSCKISNELQQRYIYGPIFRPGYSQYVQILGLALSPQLCRASWVLNTINDVVKADLKIISQQRIESIQLFNTMMVVWNLSFLQKKFKFLFKKENIQ